MDDSILRIALIPAYKPSGLMIGMLRELAERGFSVITVNDGSGSEYDHIFDEARQYSAVLEHSVNCGKGAALKTGLCYIYGTFREPYVVVTADADGQHSIDDICRTAEAAAEDPDALVIGARAFKGKVPLKSRLGNLITRGVFAVACGKMLTDTQTGLRAFSDRQVNRMLYIPGDRYEYEMNVLMQYAKSHTTIKEVPIETIYIDGNSSSHFRPFADSYRIYKEILRFSASSLVSFAVDYGLFCLLSALSGSVIFSNIAARIVSGTVNFEINCRLVFRSKASVKRSALGYIALALFILVMNTVLLTFLTDAAGMNRYLAKILTEAAMFILSWSVQRTAVFGNSGNERENTGVMRSMKHRYLWAAGYGAAIVMFTGYVMLDTFVIPTVAVADASAINTSLFADETTAALTETKPLQETEKSDPGSSQGAKSESGTSDESRRERPGSTGTGAVPEKPSSEHPSSGDRQLKKASADDSGSSAETEAAPDRQSPEAQETSASQPDETADTGTTVASSSAAYSAAAPETSVSTNKSSRSPKSGSGRSKERPSSRSKTSRGKSGSTVSSDVTTTASSDGESYSDSSIAVMINEYYENDTRIYVADVRLSSAQYLKTAFANDTYGKNVTAATSETAAAKNAILAINGDYYGAKESGYVIRNGVLYRDKGSADTDVLCIYADGHFEITNSSEKTAQQLIDEGVWQAFSFGPALVENGTVAVSKNDEVGKAMASNPRTAIGIIDDLHYVFVVADGRTSESAGLSLKQLADFMQGLGVQTAYNLDGGGSTTMYFDGKVLNNPTTSGNSIGERKVSDIVYIGY